MRVVVLILVLCVSACTCRISASGGASVTVLKCCPQGQILAQNNVCKQGANSWPPHVYSPSAGRFLDTIPHHWRVVEGVRPKCTRSCALTTLWSHAASPLFVLFDNGSLLLEFNKFFDPGTFCVDGSVAIVCSEENCQAAEQIPSQVVVKKSKVKKCCGEGAVFSDVRQHCIALPESYSNNVTLANFSSLPIDTSTVNLSLGFPVCQDLVVAGKLEDGVKLEDDGSLYVPGAKTILKPEEFCIEHILENPNDKASIITCAESLPVKTTPKWDLRFTLYPIGLFLSAFFLAATLAAGCVLPTSHHMLHWRCQTGHVSCLLVGDIILAITQLAGEKVSGGACVTMAVLMHFFFLAAFFWLNTMCFNIWWTFRDLRPASLDKGQEAFRLRLYQMYAWGGPLLIAGVAAILDSLPEDSYSVLRPRFGQQRCWFYGDVEIFPYFYGPVGVLLVINLMLFTATAHELTCGLWKREVVKSNTERATLGRVCVKLVVVMGLTWVADVVSWAVGGPHYIWYVTDLINALQGVFIFIVAGCQPQVWSAINRLWCLRPQHAQRANMGHHLSLYSQGPPSLGDSVTNNHSTKTGQLETLC